MEFAIERAYPRCWNGCNAVNVQRSNYEYTSLKSLIRRHNGELKIKRVSQRVMELLPNDEFTIDQVYKKCGINGNSIRSVISRAVKKGLIERVNDNKGNNEATYIKTGAEQC
ncbi:hypothetical protein PP411_gp23 [Vibrio phage vB_VpP_BT-1011]|uniref:Uncharacterized protein n=1 Tax=Vibrio phage vB_VpP_BT-1011 TaxID=2799672 RepID=A0A8F2XWY1_9CAUD|nr:hypothetical protein PP411_gp23 [Vibrio phage vB_VpP_BT-1011]QWX10222.1 hypothetical protein vBVpPBT1011_0023 [Vibrio phage vB_VpP_BT-1011]